MAIQFSDQDWAFIEARLLRHPRYRDSKIRAEASQYVHWWINHLVNELHPNSVKRQAGHVSAEDRNKARNEIVGALDKWVRTLNKWERLPEYSYFFRQTQYEVLAEIDNPIKYLDLPKNASIAERRRAIQEQQPGDFHDFKFQLGTLNALLQRHQRAAARVKERILTLQDHSVRNYRSDTITRRIFAQNLAMLWEQMTGTPPKISNNSGFFRLINHLNCLLGERQRSVSSLRGNGTYLTIRQVAELRNLLASEPPGHLQPWI